MTEIKSRLDVRDHGRWAELKNTVRFSGYVLLSFLVWFFYGALVRRAYRKAVREERKYYVDNMPSGRRPQ